LKLDDTLLAYMTKYTKCTLYSFCTTIFLSHQPNHVCVIYVVKCTSTNLRSRFGIIDVKYVLAKFKRGGELNT